MRTDVLNGRLKSVFLSVLLLPAMLFFFPADALAGQSKGRSGGRMGGGGFAPRYQPPSLCCSTVPLFSRSSPYSSSFLGAASAAPGAHLVAPGFRLGVRRRRRRPDAAPLSHRPSAPISRSYGGSQVSRPMTSSPGAATAGASTATKPASSTTAPTSAASTTAAAAPGAASHAAAPHAPHAAAPAAAAPHHGGWRPFGGFGMGLGLGMGMSMMNPFGGFGMGMMSPFGMFGYRPMFFGPSLGTIVMGVGLGLLVRPLLANALARENSAWPRGPNGV